jgi:hypothetical protein
VSSESELLAERYGIGRTPNRSAKLALVIATGTVLIAFLIWAALFVISDSTRLKPQTNGYLIVSGNSATVDFTLEISDQKSAGATCAVEVLASDYSIVGYREFDVAYPGGTFSVEVATTKPGVTGLVEECWSK